MSKDKISKIEIVKVITLIYFLLCAVMMIGSGFKWAAGGEEQATRILSQVTNPIVGLFLGAFATALVQSSSTVTSVIVALVGGGMPVSIAIPMIMGANIGTTITNTIVSMGHINDDKEFKEAFSAATIHDFFNWLSVVIFLPLEIMFGFLEKISLTMTGMFGAMEGGSSFNFIKFICAPFVGMWKSVCGIFPGKAGGVALVLVGLCFIFGSIFYLGKILKNIMTNKAKGVLESAVGKGPIRGIVSGTITTILVQSSSTTTSLIIPFVGKGYITVRQAYPFTLGANIGTCITALMASMSVTGDTAAAALQIALVHLVYNFLAVVIIYGTPFLREIPMKISTWLAHKSSEHKAYGIAYIVTTFFVVPGLLMLL